MQVAVRREIKTMVEAIPTSDDYLQWAGIGKLNQSVVIADSIGFSRYAEAAISDGHLDVLA